MLVYYTVEKQRKSRDKLQNKKNIHCTRETNTSQEKQELGNDERYDLLEIKKRY